MNHNYSCQVCGALALRNVEGYADLPRVTSDSRPWALGGSLVVCNECGGIQKLPTPEWLEETKKIYGDYDLWSIAGGEEQPIFQKSGSVQPKSTLLVKFLREEAALPERGTLLDIGCGTGAAIANFSKSFPYWELNGAELTERALPSLKEIPGFKRLFTCPLAAVEENFDLVLMIHSLEHFPSPGEVLSVVGERTKQGGLVFVQIPNVADNPFDIVVVDHATHLVPQHLSLLAQRAGLDLVCLRRDLIPKEVTMIARHTMRKIGTSNRLEVDQLHTYADQCIAWLKSLLSEARECAAKSKSKGVPFGIFGTSIAGMWLYGALRGSVEFFVDEDILRQGAKWDGLVVYSPESVPPNALVYVPLIPEVACEVAARLSTGGATYVAPAAIVLMSERSQ